METPCMDSPGLCPGYLVSWLFNLHPLVVGACESFQQIINSRGAFVDCPPLYFQQQARFLTYSKCLIHLITIKFNKSIFLWVLLKGAHNQHVMPLQLKPVSILPTPTSESRSRAKVSSSLKIFPAPQGLPYLPLCFLAHRSAFRVVSGIEMKGLSTLSPQHWAWCLQRAGIQKPFAKSRQFLFFFVFQGGSQGNWRYSCWPTSQPQQCQIQAESVTCTTAHGNVGSLTPCARPRIEPVSSWILVRFFSTEPRWELLRAIFK